MADAGRRNSQASQPSQVSGPGASLDGVDVSKMDPEELAEAEEVAARAAAKLALAKKAKLRKALRVNTKRFFEAAKAGDVGELKDVVANGVGVDAEGGVGPTTKPEAVGFRALHFAASGGEEGHVEALAYLLEQGADVHAATVGKGWTALDFAAFWGRDAAVTWLLEWGADPAHLDASGRTAREKAVFRKHGVVITVLDDWTAAAAAAAVAGGSYDTYSAMQMQRYGGGGGGGAAAT
jgi:ankyrin repeat protein